MYNQNKMRSCSKTVIAQENIKQIDFETKVTYFTKIGMVCKTTGSQKINVFQIPCEYLYN